MTKKLKLRIVKFHELFVVERLEQKGKFKETEHIRIKDGFDFNIDSIDLPKSTDKDAGRVFCCHCSTNAQRDAFISDFVDWIMDEQFNYAGKVSGSLSIEGEIYTWELK